MIRACCMDRCIHWCTHPHIHECPCTLAGEPNETGQNRYEDHRSPKKSETDNGESATATSFLSRTLPRSPSPMDILTSEQHEAGLKRWRDFAQFGAIQDDYKRAGKQLPERLRRAVARQPAPANEQEKPRLSHDKDWLLLDDFEAEVSQPTGVATTKSDDKKQFDPEKPLIEFD